MNSGPYVDHDAQEYRPGPVTPACRVCDLPTFLCACPPDWHREPDTVTAYIGWWPVAILAIAAVVVCAIWERGVM